MKLDALIIGAHPDDAEIAMGGTILRLQDAGKRVGILDITRGEMGTRGSQEDRDRETAAATKLLGLSYRENLNLPDGRVVDGVPEREALALKLRSLQPELVITHHREDLHPDHAAVGRMTREAWYLSGLRRLAELDGGAPAKRPARLLYYLGHVAFDPTLVVNIDAQWERKLELIRCYGSQIQPQAKDDKGAHFLFGADILSRTETRARYFGEKISASFGEPLYHEGPLPVDDLFGF